MPELPEIEVVRRTVAPHLLGARIVVERIGPHDLRSRGRGRAQRRDQHGAAQPWIQPRDLLHNATIARLHRHGKQLALEAHDGRVLVIQLGMSGQLQVEAAGHERVEATHRHVEWKIQRLRVRTAKSAPCIRLVLRDPRRFGGVHCAQSMEQLKSDAWLPLGPDALTISSAQLAGALRGSRAIKSALLDQTCIAGVGNIYADEALFAAGIAPHVRARTLGASAVAKLARELRRILRSALNSGGSTLRDHRSATGARGQAQLSHAVYGRAKQPCIRCGRVLSSKHFSGRTTVWCRGCQR